MVRSFAAFSRRARCVVGAAGAVGWLMVACVGAKAPEGRRMVVPALPPSATGAIADDKPARARLMMLRGEASEIADAPQAAAEAYTAAIGLAPEVPRYYLRLAELYRAVRAERDAEAVLREGARICRDASSATERAKMLLGLVNIAAERGDPRGARERLAELELLLPTLAPELSFDVALRYAELEPAEPSDRQRARAHFATFQARICGSGNAASFKESCELSAIWLQRIAQTDGEETNVAVPTRSSIAEGDDSALPPRLPVPRVTVPALRAGDAFTVFGAGYFLRSRHHRSEVNGKRISVRGYVVKTNLPEAARCAVHAVGMADADDCRAEIPTFWLGDRPDTPLAETIPVMGFASNFAQIHDALVQLDSGSEEPFVDVYWGQVLPRPLPTAGAEVLVSGRYGTAFSKSSSGAVANPSLGILDFETMATLEVGPVPATLPGMKRK